MSMCIPLTFCKHHTFLVDVFHVKLVLMTWELIGVFSIAHEDVGNNENLHADVNLTT